MTLTDSDDDEFDDEDYGEGGLLFCKECEQYSDRTGLVRIDNLSSMCKRCGSRSVAEIVYGYLPEPDDEFKKELDSGKVTMGGCGYSDISPRWECNDCSFQWGLLPEDTESD